MKPSVQAFFEIPANYGVNLAPLTSAVVGLLGVSLTAYLLLG